MSKALIRLKSYREFEQSKTTQITYKSMIIKFLDSYTKQLFDIAPKDLIY